MSKQRKKEKRELDVSALPTLPSAWCWATVEQLGSLNEQTVLTGPFGSTLGRDDFVAQGVPLLTIGCLTEQGVTLDKAFYVTEEKANALGRYRVREGDLLFSRSASVGRAGCVNGVLNGCIINYHLMRLRLADEIIQPQTFMYYVRGSEVVRAYLREVNHGATRDGINTTDLLGMPVAVPPVAEQKRLTDRVEELFSDLDAVVASLERVQRNLKRYRASVLKAAVEGRLVPTEAELARREGRDYEPASVLLERILKERRHRWIEDAAEKGRAKAKEKAKKAGKPWTTKDNTKTLEVERAKADKKYKEPAKPDAEGLAELPEGWCWVTWEQIGFSQNGRAFPSKEYQSAGIKLLRPGNLHVSGRVDWTEKNTRYMPQRWAEEHPEHLVGPGELVMNLTAQSLADEFLGRICVTGPRDKCLLNQRIARLTPTLVNTRFMLWLMKNVERCQRLRQSILKWAFEGKLVDQDPDDEPACVLLERIQAERAAVAATNTKEKGSSRKSRRAIR